MTPSSKQKTLHRGQVVVCTPTMFNIIKDLYLILIVADSFFKIQDYNSDFALEAYYTQSSQQPLLNYKPW